MKNTYQKYKCKNHSATDLIEALNCDRRLLMIFTEFILFSYYRFDCISQCMKNENESVAIVRFEW